MKWNLRHGSPLAPCVLVFWLLVMSVTAADREAPYRGGGGETLTLDWTFWGTLVKGAAYWDHNLNGRFDVLDLLFFGNPYFEDATQAAGILTEHHTLPDFFSIGQAWGDYDRDGYPDLYVTDAAGLNTLFHNEGDGSFSVSSLAAVTGLVAHASAGATFVDFNNDGWLDLYVVGYGPNVLFRNQGGAGFSDISISAGIDDPGKGQTACWGDFNKDGLLDVYIVNWGEPGTFEDRFYRNNGDETFTDITSGLGPRVAGAGFTASFVDYDNDADLDIYLVNDKLLGNVLWRNDDPQCLAGCFSEVSTQSGADIQVFGMGLAVGDYDGDLDLDFYFSHLGPMVLLQNQTVQGSATFLNMGAAAGVSFDAIGWGTAFLDFDNDGWLDLYLATMDSQPERVNRLYRNLGNGTFQDVSYRGGAAHTGPSLGVAYSDYDRDGFLDLAIGNWGSGYVLYHNRGVAGAGRNWLNVALVAGGGVNRDGVGAKVYLERSDGRVLFQEVKCGSSLGAGNEMNLHFGLGEAEVSTLTVIWPDGQVQNLAKLSSNQFLTIFYPLQ